MKLEEEKNKFSYRHDKMDFGRNKMGGTKVMAHAQADAKLCIVQPETGEHGVTESVSVSVPIQSKFDSKLFLRGP